jgi:hypothetical protein
MGETQPGQLLYLYSSNIRPLYAQDIIDLLAAPGGYRYQFRYDQQYIPDFTKQAWSKLKDTPVLVLFSLQQEAKYQPAAFIPVRAGKVHRAFTLGAIYVVEFSLGEYVSLREPEKDDRGRPDMARQVTEFTDYVGRKELPRPYRHSAGLGDDLLKDPGAAVGGETDQMVLFSRTVAYLQGTQSFRSARFYRFHRVAEFEAGESDALEIDESGVFELVGGKTYELAIFHHQPTDVVRPERFNISVDQGVIQVVGRTYFDIASRYDIVTVPFHAVESPVYETRSTIILVEPAEGVEGPRLRLPLRVKTSRGRAGVAVAGSAAGLFLVALPGIWKSAGGNMPLEWALPTSVIGSLMVAFLAVLGLKRG